MEWKEHEESWYLLRYWHWEWLSLILKYPLLIHSLKKYLLNTYDEKNTALVLMEITFYKGDK